MAELEDLPKDLEQLHILAASPHLHHSPRFSSTASSSYLNYSSEDVQSIGSVPSSLRSESHLLRRPSRTGGYFTCGRPPWYDFSKGCAVKKKPAFVIGVSGGTSSGKTTVCHRIVEELDIPWAVIVSQDSFYKSLEGDDLRKAEENNYNFDHPDAFDYELMIKTLRALKQGEEVQVPIYDFVSHTRGASSQRLYGADIILFEGILAFYNKELLDLFDLKIFVDTDADLRLARRLRRDIADRGRDVDGVLSQYERFVKPAFDGYIEPTRRRADIIIPNDVYNPVAINLITQHLKTVLHERGVKLRSLMLHTKDSSQQFDPASMSNLVVLRETPQLKSVHTMLRDRNQDRENFIFLATRLTRMLIETALASLPFEDHTVTTPTGAEYHGKRAMAKLCGVSVMRAGESMEVALLEVCKDVRIGKVLIQSSPVSREPRLVYKKLPHDISDRYVLIMDPMIGTAATALMAIRVVLDHGVPEEKILFLTMVAAPEGLTNIAYAFPKVRVCTTAIDQEVTPDYFVIPGIGNFGDRYFGTGVETMQEEES